MPFTREQFFQVFADYNAAIWPLQWGFVLLALAAVILALGSTPNRSRAIGGILSLLWIWMGAVYHLAFFASVNPAARVFGALFILAGASFAWAAARRGRLVFEPHRDAAGIAGGILIAYALVGYPLAGLVAGHQYPAAPTFGAPCPTTIFTLGLLLWARGHVPWALVVIPLAWTLVGTSAAVALGVAEDFGLAVAGIAVVAFALARKRRGAKPALAGARLAARRTPE